MLTGIVEKTGLLLRQDHGHGLHIDAGPAFDTRPGDSVAVNGCCLTVTNDGGSVLSFDVSTETLAKTALGSLREGDEVNLERAMKLGDRLGGHLVSGHIDGVGRVSRVRKDPGGWDIEIAVPQALGRYLIAKGSICLDGVSLTVNTLRDQGGESFVGLMLIPTTVHITTLKNLREGLPVNVEVDPIAKYVERLSLAHLK